MSRVLVIGIDAMDRGLLSRFAPHLPNLSRVKRENPELRLSCVYPPDTPTAWASIYTGLNPAKHGLVYFVDALEKTSIFASENLENSAIRGRTFWDLASHQGKRVCILLPPLGYPVWPVNGVMVGRSNDRYSKTPLQTHPFSLAEQYSLQPLSPIKALPQKSKFPEYIDAYKKLVLAETELGLKLWRQEKWDVFFIYSSALDWVGHNLWSYFDEEDPLYPGENPYKDVFLQFYLLYDRMVGQFLAETDQETVVIILSDHGQTRRPSKLVNINELLREEGLLTPRRRGDWRQSFGLLEGMKRGVTWFFNRYGAGALTMRMVHRLPRLRQTFTLPRSIDWEKTCAYVSDLSGIKAYSYGGLIINREKLGKKDYEGVRSRLVQLLREIKEPGSGERLARWACRREELYAGEHLYKYPDILFELKEGYGVGWAVHAPLLSPCPTHNIQPGSHKGDSAVLLLSNLGSHKIIRRDVTLMDIAPTVLGFLGIRGCNGDGESFLE